MKLYTVTINHQSMSGDTHDDIAAIYDSKEKAQEIVDRFNSLPCARHLKYGYPEAELGTMELNTCTIEFDKLGELNEDKV